jgi:hypothetical protein
VRHAEVVVETTLDAATTPRQRDRQQALEKWRNSQVSQTARAVLDADGGIRGGRRTKLRQPVQPRGQSAVSPARPQPFSSGAPIRRSGMAPETITYDAVNINGWA